MKLPHRRIHRAACLLICIALMAACASRQPSEPPGELTASLSPRTALPTFIPQMGTATPVPSQTPFVTYSPTPTIEPIPTRTPTNTRPPTLTPTFTLTPFEGVISTGCGGRPAQSDNLLINGGMEGFSHTQENTDVNIPDGWVGFWIAPGTPVSYDPGNPDGYQRPEIRVIQNQPPYDVPRRVLEGFQALRITGNGRVYDVGIYQQVPVVAGRTYCLIGYGHAWSRLRGDDPLSSTLESPDDRRNANFQLGIDPFGGIDPWALSVQRGGVAQIYDIYQQIPSVMVRAEGNVITVVVRGYVLWRFDHNDLYIDGISLVEVTP